MKVNESPSSIWWRLPGGLLVVAGLRWKWLLVGEELGGGTASWAEESWVLTAL
jgi:hypothetical protein